MDAANGIRKHATHIKRLLNPNTILAPYILARIPPGI